MRALAAAALATLLVVPCVTSTPPRRIDAPLAQISCDLLPIKGPTPVEAGEDERTKPYHALVRVFHLPTLEPYDVPLEWVQLLGSERSRRVAPGEYLFDDVKVGYTTAVVSDGTKSEVATSVGSVMRRNVLASRNPLVLARWATTTCDLFVLDPDRGGDLVKFHGLLSDRETGAPVAGATVWCAGAKATSGPDGRFALEAPVAWKDLLTHSRVDADGYDSFLVGGHGLFGPWIRRLVKEGDANFTLHRSAAPPSPLLPALAKQ
jgi:hypothetical protein